MNPNRIAPPWGQTLTSGQKGAGEDETDPDPLGRPDGGLRVRVAAALDVEEVHDGRDAVAEHLGEGEDGPDLDPLGVESPRERITDRGPGRATP
jgi:hypothetical protein